MFPWWLHFWKLLAFESELGVDDRGNPLEFVRNDHRLRVFNCKKSSSWAVVNPSLSKVTGCGNNSQLITRRWTWLFTYRYPIFWLHSRIKGLSKVLPVRTHPFLCMIQVIYNVLFMQLRLGQMTSEQNSTTADFHLWVHFLKCIGLSPFWKWSVVWTMTHGWVD